MLGDVSPGGGDERWPSLEAEPRLGVRTELLFPPRLQEEAASDLEGVATAEAAAAEMLFGEELPKEVPPLMIVVPGFGVAG